MEQEVVKAELVLPTHLNFKKIQMYEKYPKGQSRGRHWKHLKQIIQAENYQNYPTDEPNYVNIESPPSMHPCKRICDITGFEYGWDHENRIVKTNGIPMLSRGRFCPETPEINTRLVNYWKAPYYDPRTTLRYANTDVFKTIRSLPNDYVQRYLALRNAAVVLK